MLTGVYLLQRVFSHSLHSLEFTCGFGVPEPLGFAPEKERRRASCLVLRGYISYKLRAEGRGYLAGVLAEKTDVDCV